MENQPILKWYQKPVTVILFLIFFFPVGLYLMWKHDLWNKTTRVIVSVFFGLLVIANMNSNSETGFHSDLDKAKVSIKKCSQSDHKQFIITRFKDVSKTISGMRVEQTYDCGYLFLVEGIDYSRGLGFDCYVKTNGSNGQIEIIGTECEVL